MKTKKGIPLLLSVLAVASIISIGVLGNTQNVYAGGAVTNCTIEPTEVKLQLGPNEVSDIIPKKITCNAAIGGFSSFPSTTCGLNEISIGNVGGFNTSVLTFDETIENLGDISEEHCIVTFIVLGDAQGGQAEVFQELWINEPQIAGELLPLDSTALFLAGIQSMTVWMVPTILGLAGAGVYLVKFRK